MTKILAQTGASLADVYDVKGSVVSVEQLASREVFLTHDMGATIFSERFTNSLRHSTSGAIAQDISWAVNLGEPPTTPYRLTAIQVRIDTAARVLLASIAIRNPDNDRECPIWSWSSATDSETLIRFSVDGAAAGAVIFLQPSPANVLLPQLIAGSAQPAAISDPPSPLVLASSELIFRGTSAGFGAGTVTCNVVMHISFPTGLGGINSHGLPIPSW